MQNAECRTQNEEREGVVAGFLNSSFCVLHSAFILFALIAVPAAAQVLDHFNSTLDWLPHPSDGVSLDIIQDPAGREGAAMRLDFDFHGHAGYAIARKSVSIDLPADYEFSFWIKGSAPPNNLEFKLIDATGDNVWWVNQRNFDFPRDWQRVVLKKRHFEFAWGPAGGGEPHHIAAIEMVVTAGSGGRGSVWIDDLALEERHVTAIQEPAAFRSSSIDFPEVREMGGFIVDSNLRDYDLQVSNDARQWQTVYSVRGATPGRHALDTPELEAAHIRISPRDVRSIIVEPVAWSVTPNDFFANVARDSNRGDYPRSFHQEQSYWTVVGVDGDTREALFNADGAVEPFKGGFSIEPFLYDGTKLIAWSDVQATQSLQEGYLPIPSVRWPQLTITASASGKQEESVINVRYTSHAKGNVTLFLAIRPFQVDPPWQFLGVTGGVANIREISYHDGVLHVGGEQVIAKAARFGAATFDQGNIVDWLRRGTTPDAQSVTDPRGRASGVLAFPLRQNQTATITIPLHVGPPLRRPDRHRLRAGATSWQQKLNRVTIRLPPSARRITDTIHASLAYILIHRDGPSLQPGSRSYERSWIRDGSMISEALLRLGLPEVVREYIEWYVTFQYPDGKVPCCVDSRGADPVPENDSHGELIYLIAEYFRHTHDRALAERVWPHVVAAVDYIDKLRHTQTAPEFLGLLPESISHEGYSAKPMHSYWDDFFAAKGLADSVDLAEALGRAEDARRFAVIRDQFERDLVASIRHAMAAHKIDYIPGSVELGDYDPTSTTIAIAPGGQGSKLPPEWFSATFDRYFESARKRTRGEVEWESYTPYELRTVGTFVRLGQLERAHELLDFFFRGQRPAAWRQWAEVVWHDPKTPKFIGDMPHGWVASDYLRSVLDMFAYDRDDGVLVIGAGIKPEWVTQSPGVVVRGLSTHEGRLDFTMRGHRAHISGTVDPRKGIVIRSPFGKQEIAIHHLPADVVFSR